MAHIEKDGLWSDIRSADIRPGRPALFLDRDGTVIELVDYLSEPGQVVLIPAAVTTIRAANVAGHAVVIVTNQSGIGRGYYGWAEFEAVQDQLYGLLAAQGAVVDAAYACPHPPPDAGGPKDSAYRKPAPGMLLRAAEDLSLDLAGSRIAGDTATDLAAGRAAGLIGGIIVSTGYGSRDGERDKAVSLASDGFAVEFGLDTA